MNKIKWFKSNIEELPHYYAKIGYIDLICRSEIKCANGRIVGWCCSVYFGNKWICATKTARVYEHDRPDFALKLCQANAERMAVQYLLGHGFLTLKALKRMGLLEEILLQVGVDL